MAKSAFGTIRRRDRLILDYDVLPFFGQIAIGEVDAADVQAWVSALGARPSPASVRRVFTILDQLLDAAVDDNLIVANPAARARLPRISRAEMRFLTPVELEVLADTIAVPYRAIVLTMAWATLRIGEAVGLRRSDIDTVAGTLRVANNIVEVGSKLHEGPPKTAAGRSFIQWTCDSMFSSAAHVSLIDALIRTEIEIPMLMASPRSDRDMSRSGFDGQ
jgi:integrase